MTTNNAMVTSSATSAKKLALAAVTGLLVLGGMSASASAGHNGANGCSASGCNLKKEANNCKGAASCKGKAKCNENTCKGMSTCKGKSKCNANSCSGKSSCAGKDKASCNAKSSCANKNTCHWSDLND